MWQSKQKHEKSNRFDTLDLNEANLDEEAKAERADAKAERTGRAAERQRAYDRRMEEQWRPREKASMKDVEVEEVDWDELDEAPPPRRAAAPPPPQGLLGSLLSGRLFG